MIKASVIKYGDVYTNPKNIKGNGRGAVYDTRGLAPTIMTMSGGVINLW